MLERLRRSRTVTETAEQRARRQELVAGLTFEVIPFKSLDAAIETLPTGSRVSVTASPTKGMDATCTISEQLIALGHTAIPHFSARLIRDRTHTRQLATWSRRNSIKTIFCVGGDVTEPNHYLDALSFLRDLLDCDHGLETVGVTGYPDGHPLIEAAALDAALHGKQELLASAGLSGYCSTQMCFDHRLIVSWLRSQRNAGLELPVHLGLSGVVDRAKLLSMGARLGIGQSLRYLRKNRSAITKMMTTPGYDPDDVLSAMSPHLGDLKIDGLHVFTFNQIAATAQWQAQSLRAG